MNKEYKKHKEKLLEVKKNIDKEVEKNGISPILLSFKSDLENSYKKAIQNTDNPSDKKFISFNYFAPKTYILLAEGYKFESVNSFCEAVYHYIQYLNHISNPDFNKWNLKYYHSILPHLEKADIELFGNTSTNAVKKILNSLQEILSIHLNHSNFKISVDRMLSDFLFYLVDRSSEIYTREHLETAKTIKDIASLFTKDDNRINGISKSLEFILAKRELHYYLRQLVPTKNQNIIDKNSIDRNIKEVIENMKKIAHDEIKFFKNIPNDTEEGISFKKFLAEIDKLSSEYYESLWIKRDLIDTFKKLETIFFTIRNNWQKITTSNIFSHFVQEFVFLNNYFKLLLLEKDFREFRERLAEKEWQKEVSIKVEEFLNKITSQLFKYAPQTSLERKLLIVEEASSGKFVEFIVFYLLREIIINKIELKNIIKNISNQAIRNLLSVVSETRDISQIQWSHRTSDEAPDIDILIDGKHGIFLKTGVLNSNDIKKIFNEVELSKRINLRSVFQIIDIAKNLDTAPKLLKEYTKVNLIDVGEFLNILLDIAYSSKKIALKLSKSSILSWAGFYSGG